MTLTDRLLIFAALGVLLCLLMPWAATCYGVLVGWGVILFIEWVRAR